MEAERRYRETGVLALDLVNTWDPYLADPERLPDLLALRRFLVEHDVGARVRRADLADCRALRDRLRGLVAASSPALMARRFNELVARMPAAPVLEPAGGGWRLGIKADPAAPLAERVAVLALTELADVLARYGPERVRECAAAPCREAFVDSSRNGRRRYCSERCANRHNATRHRARLRRAR